jgi:CYTH domain-containing protein/predicted ATPase
MKTKEGVIPTLGKDITIIVITGGPCGGKTTGLAVLSQKLADRGYKVLISPESATKLITAGMKPQELPNLIFQEEILLDVIEQEHRLISIAKRYRDLGRKVVIFCDRGTVDGEAYAGVEDFKSIIARHGCDYNYLCNDRYHAIIHLRTAALGAESYYTLNNNNARYESLEQAQSVDQRTLDAWTRHQHPRVIDNSTDFDGKIHRLLTEVCAVLGDPVPLEQEDKFLIDPFSEKDIPAKVKFFVSHITQTYLISPVRGEERRLRMRRDENSACYFYTIKKDVSPGVRIEIEKGITAREYAALYEMRYQAIAEIQKKRICFFWKEQFFEIDSFMEPVSNLFLMEAERTDRSPDLKIPPFVKVIKNVTGDKQYSNLAIAEHGYPMSRR